MTIPRRISESKEKENRLSPKEAHTENREHTENTLKHPHFNRCCCFTARTGSLIYGFTGIILHSILLIFFGWVYFESPEIETTYPLIQTRAGIILLVVALKIIVYIFLLSGVFMRSSTLLRLFIIIEALFLIFQDIGYVYYLGKNGGSVYVFLAILVYSVCIIFLIIVVHSFITQISNEAKQSSNHV